MTRAIIARQNGDDYQALFFWREACELFYPHTKVSKVGYEHSSIKSFDDVVKFYSKPILDTDGSLINTDYFQLKFHVDYDDFFTYENLTVPAFIGAESESFLQKLLNAQREHAPEGIGVRFYLVSPWQLHPDNSLRNLISAQDGEIRLPQLFSPKKNKRVRQYWCNHLGLCDENELQLVLRPLRIWSGSEPFERLKSATNIRLMAAGFKPMANDKRTFNYIELIKRLHAEGKTIFSRDDLQDIAAREDLWLGQGEPSEEFVDLGLRSFMPRAENMEHFTEKMLCLVKHFDNRVIRNPQLWHGTIYPEVKKFFAESADSTRQYRLYLDTHNSIAFAAGYELHSKTGIKIDPMQSTRDGRILWRPDKSVANAEESLWQISSLRVKQSSEANDVALAISVSRDVTQDVELYVQEHLPKVGRIIESKVNPFPGQAAVRDATHGFQLVEQLFNFAVKRSPAERRGKLHIFASAPNATLFWLGQSARGLGACTIYEYDFDAMTPGGYLPAITFPVG
jgi:hypothetical protein